MFTVSHVSAHEWLTGKSWLNACSVLMVGSEILQMTPPLSSKVAEAE